MRYTTTLFATLIAAGIAGCGGGGGTSSTPAAGPSSPASSSGDMMAIAASRGWNYQTSYGGQSLTLTLYADPTPSNGVQSIVAAGQNGLVTTVATSAANMQAGEAGVLGVSQDASHNYKAVSEVSSGSSGTIPGSPLLVPSTLTVGQTWSPYAGVNATVLDVGTVPGEAACPTPTATGATVQYTYSQYSVSVSYVPGCGITDLLDNANGAEFKLTSIGSYPSIGQLSIARKAQSVTLLDTAASLLGARRSNFPAAALFGPLLANAR